MSPPGAQSGDRLLGLAAVAVGCMGLAWLFVEAPWATRDSSEAVALAGSLPAQAPESAPATDIAPAEAGEARDPLYLARLALDTGMLIDPPEYSAWTLFGEAVEADPGNAAARDGLDEVAAALLGRGRTALEQGRLDDAEQVANTIIGRLPDHAGALALSAEIVVARRPPPVVAERPAPAAPRRPDPVDRIPDLHAAFTAAMGRNAVLTPSGESARDIVVEMLGIAPEHELAASARELLVTELLDRSAQALEALDTAGAQAWIDSASPLAGDSPELARAQERLTRHLIDAESKKRLPLSAFEQTVKVAAEYPRFAIDRDIEGWVDVEFVVTPEGETADITVVASSHSRYFQSEAIAAVEQWRFEPVVFMGQAIPQHAYTRLEFVLN